MRIMIGCKRSEAGTYMIGQQGVQYFPDRELSTKYKADHLQQLVPM